MVRRVALAAEVPRFSTHTTRHLCLTDLARMGWEVHAIATFAGHRSTDSTLRYIHLSGRDLAEKLNASMAQIHAWRMQHAHRTRPRCRAGRPGVTAPRLRGRPARCHGTARAFRPEARLGPPERSCSPAKLRR